MAASSIQLNDVTLGIAYTQHLHKQACQIFPQPATEAAVTSGAPWQETWNEDCKEAGMGYGLHAKL